MMNGNSIEQFTDFLEILKTKINKVLIIEHTHPINFDCLISVSKDKNLISSLTIEK